MGCHGARGLVLAALSAAFWAGAAAAEPVCSAEAVFLQTSAGAQIRLSTEIADDPAERALGLMNRERMAASASMLFVYPEPERVSFWMRSTLIPLDMIFLDETGVVTRVHPNAVPLDETAIDGGEGVKYVIEINGGMASSLGIGVGTVMLHPAVDPAIAKWPCRAG